MFEEYVIEKYQLKGFMHSFNNSKNVLQRMGQEIQFQYSDQILKIQLVFVHLKRSQFIMIILN